MTAISTKQAVICWIDDDIEKSSSNARRRLNEFRKDKRLLFIPLHPALVNDYLEKPKRAPDLFLVDYRLNKEPSTSGKTYPFAGTSIAGLLRDTYPEQPIYLTSALIASAHVSEETDLFDRTIPDAELTKPKGKSILLYDSLAYRRIRTSRGRSNVKTLADLLKAPALSGQYVINALPDDLRDGLGKRHDNVVSTSEALGLSGTIRFARWITRTLLRNPGILYDDLYAATLLGMSEDYFNSRLVNVLRKHELGPTLEYVGVFNETYPRYWWKAALSKLVLGHPDVRDQKVSKVWELAPEIFRVNKKNRARCIVCRKPFPETVGVDLDDEDRRGPVHWHCSEPHPDKQPILHFEQVRILLDS